MGKNMEFLTLQIKVSTRCHSIRKKTDIVGERLWIDSNGVVYVILVRNKILYYDPIKGVFTEDDLPIDLPEEFRPNHIFEDSLTGFYWIAGQQGMVVYDPNTEKNL